jgi:hypothetical protein
MLRSALKGKPSCSMFDFMRWLRAMISGPRTLPSSGVSGCSGK